MGDSDGGLLDDLNPKVDIVPLITSAILNDLSNCEGNTYGNPVSIGRSY